MKPTVVAAVLFAACSIAGAAIYYVDPATGSMTNAGTSSKPWSTLEAVFTNNKTFAPGDVILLRSGYHGNPQIKGTNAGVVTIRPDVGAVAALRRLTVRTATRWLLFGLDICPGNAGPGVYDPNLKIVDIQNTCNFITVRNCSIRGALNIAGWTQGDWTNRLGGGSALSTAAPNTLFLLNDIRNASFGIQVLKSATNSVVSRNTIRDYFNDGIRGLGDFCLFEYNAVMNQYVSDANHDDCFQSWSTGPTGIVGEGTVYNVTLRGNLFLSHTDSAQPLKASVQGIGCFDGMFENWVIENNVISSATYHGISLYGAINCRIVNNTVIENPVDGSTSVKPWIMITEHKKQTNGNAWPVPSSGNLIRNNISAAAASLTSTGGGRDHNITTTAYTNFFINYTNFDFALLPNAAAVEAGDTNGAPLMDITRHLRSSPCDVGAYAYAALPSESLAYASWQSDWFPNDPASGAPEATPLNDGLPNMLKYVLNINPLLPVGALDQNALPFFGLETEGDTRYFAWTLRTNAQAADVHLEIMAYEDLALAAWQKTTPDVMQVLSRDPATGDRVMKFKFDAMNPRQKFFRLRVVSN